MAKVDPRKVGLSKNCMDALVEYSTIAPSIELDEHMCLVHKNQQECKNVEKFGHRMWHDARANITKWCFIEPQKEEK